MKTWDSVMSLLTKKNFITRFFSVAIFLLFSGIAYCLLLKTNHLHTSIADIIGSSHHLALNRHILVLCMLPIYIAIVIFGMAVLSIYLSSKIESYFINSRSDLKKNRIRTTRLTGCEKNALFYVRKSTKESRGQILIL